MANRQGRVKALIGKDISDILTFELKNPHIGMVSVNEVAVNSDNSLAKVYVSFIGTKHPKQNLEELTRCKGVVRSLLAKKLDIFKVPDILFLLDESFDKSASLDKALAKEAGDLASLKKGK
ncbi:MAG: 30S ribosome-binding factor RbfA [Bacilli bacterium]